MSSCLWDSWSSVASPNLSLRRSSTRPIADLITIVYSAGAEVVLKGKQMHRWARLSTMETYVDKIHVFTWMRLYAASRSVFPIRMIFDGHLICMDVIMWSILRGKNA